MTSYLLTILLTTDDDSLDDIFYLDVRNVSKIRSFVVPRTTTAAVLPVEGMRQLS